MPHRVDIDSIHESIFILLNTVFASRSFCIEHRIKWGEDRGRINYGYYFGWLRYMLSERLLSVAIRTRLLMDVLAAEARFYEEEGETFGKDVFELEREVSSQYDLGVLTPSNGAVTVRTACNKIVHADDIQPVQESCGPGGAQEQSSLDGDTACEWVCWNGELMLSGRQAGKSWCLQLNVAQFCHALDEFLDLMENTYDWHHIYKHDI
jgi:hypothetical protein